METAELGEGCSEYFEGRDTGVRTPWGPHPLSAPSHPEGGLITGPRHR